MIFISDYLFSKGSKAEAETIKLSWVTWSLAKLISYFGRAFVSRSGLWLDGTPVTDWRNFFLGLRLEFLKEPIIPSTTPSQIFLSLYVRLHAPYTVTIMCKACTLYVTVKILTKTWRNNDHCTLSWYIIQHDKSVIEHWRCISGGDKKFWRKSGATLKIIYSLDWKRGNLLSQGLKWVIMR